MREKAGKVEETGKNEKIGRRIGLIPFPSPLQAHHPMPPVSVSILSCIHAVVDASPRLRYPVLCKMNLKRLVERVQASASCPELTSCIVYVFKQQDSLPLPPITPQQHKYYRDHSVNDTSATRYRQVSQLPIFINIVLTDHQPQDIFSPNHPTAPHLASPTPMRFRERGTPHQMTTTFAIPETPKRTNNYYKSPLPASSPPPQSSPFSSPTKRIVNLVSSPGPMGPLPSESDYDELPYTLPPGPYITKKPDVSYAALVGRAILASPKHALTLQEIYDWITIVHPHFKRGETTWMNSIRHVLSTTACFRKHTRERSAGRTLWAIWDCDLECFKNGGFNKQKCKDMMEGKKAIATGSKKRSAEESGERKAKRPRKSAVAAVEKEAVEAAIAAASMQSTLPPLIPPSQLHPIFPVTRPTPHHQPYFDVCVQQQPSVSATAPAPSPSEVICPPLSSSSGFQRMTSGASTSSASTYSHSSIASSDFASEPPSSATTDDSEPPSMSPPPTSSSSASISMPELTPNGSSSSPPLESEDNSMIHDYDGLDLVYPYNDDDQLFSEMLSADALEPGFTLNKYDYYQSLDKGKQRAITPPPRVRFSATYIPGPQTDFPIAEAIFPGYGCFAFVESKDQT